MLVNGISSAQAVYAALGDPEPELPPYDPDKLGKIPHEDAIVAFIEKLDREKAEGGKRQGERRQGRGGQSGQGRSKNPQSPRGKQQPGMGDHVPAFMMRPVRLP